MRLVSRRCSVAPPARTRVPRARPRTLVSASSRPLLPPIPDAIGDDERVRFVLVRHGQSTWNAEGRIQGSSDISVLTEKGKRQARDAAELLSRERFDAMAHSPLSRAAETASIVWARNEVAASAGGDLPVVPLPSLREIDLHSFQGLLKSEVNGGSDGGSPTEEERAYLTWKERPEEFELDGRAPVRDLWRRAETEAWRELFDELLSCPSRPPSPSPRFLVVAHNAVNQAMVSVALGFPPRAFRRIVQSNGCVTELALSRERRNSSPSPSSDGDGDGGDESETLATVLRLNVGPSPPLKRPSGVALVVLVSLGGGEEGERGGEKTPPPSLAKALSEARGGSQLSDAPIVLAGGENDGEDLLSSAEEAGFEREALERARVSPPSSPSSSFWRASAAAAALSPSGISLALGTREQVEGALSESLGDLTSSSAGERAPASFSAPAGGVSVVEVDVVDGASSSSHIEGTVRCTNWRPSRVRSEGGNAASARGATGAVAA